MKKEKMNDKGFSLVELIIVIAIMAVLVVVLAPQYLKYVERSRNSTDISNATAMVTACQVWAADPNAGEDGTEAFVAGDEFSIDVTTAGAVNKGAAGTDGSLSQAAITIGDVKCKSKNTWKEYHIAGKVKDDGSIEFTYTPSEFADAMKK